ncbi:MAG TPA: NADH-quinone oxidoreductase subunit L, partial [Acidimicrobiia bacterium]|nr:NADH-quinone oxidoreductase subunit L [Acidimicrobiia bacterium]
MSARNLLDLAWLIPAFPAFGAVVLLLVGNRIGEPKAGWLATAMISLSFVSSVVAFFALRSLSPHVRANVSQGFTWIQAGSFKVDFRFLVDPLSSTMTLFVTGVGSLIHLYAIGYMHGDQRFPRFFAYLNLFAASMLVLVLGSSFLLTFMGWEGVGLCSYLLISFWFERNSAAVAGKKAFITNRVGDFGFMLAMFLIFEKLGTLDYSALGTTAHVPAAISALPQSTVTAIALLLFVGAVGKSAQLPLHIWLPDAMEGPTPVSALIHAATMVTAGVFLCVRAHVFFDLSTHAGTVVAWIGAITALYAATVALVQNDIKRVLAYSTISQLGYMFLAVGVGAYGAAIFHMIMHAFFKALLFLGAGSVIHGMGDEQDMRRMGALRKYMPITAGTFIVAWLAIAGVFPFAGFWSKDEILAKAYFHHDYALWAVGLVAALATAFYMTRQVWLVFYGNERWHDQPAVESEAAHAAHEPHESPWIMTIPLVALAVLSTVGGVIDLPFDNSKLNLLDRWLAPVLRGAPAIPATSFGAGLALSTVALVIAVVGIVVGRAVYRNGLDARGDDPAVERLGPFANVLANAYYLDVGVARFVSGPITTAARFLSEGIDRDVIDGAVNGLGRTFRGIGGGLRRVQTGLVRNYALGIVLGAVLLLVFVSTRA